MEEARLIISDHLNSQSTHFMRVTRLKRYAENRQSDQSLDPRAVDQTRTVIQMCGASITVVDGRTQR